ncbi:DUF1707 SHOCT-like domain-containing protein [Granulicoccus sp. GXG6511]|uniref:DUF1707 SHOCT-like domain-containing protein n=1 Tax=Granulicoccus sp. GXG6511 TaxID=3381351 RepID=UPI003D7ECB18
MTDGHLRVGTVQRENAVEILRNAAADDRITFDELDDRVAAAFQARTQQDLATVLGDLVPAADLERALTAVMPLRDGPGYAWDNPLIFESLDGRGIYLTGFWEVPPFLELRLARGKARVDFSRATTKAPVIDIEVVGQKPTYLFVPDGWAVDGQHMNATAWSGYTGMNVRTRPRRGCPRVIVRGTGMVVARAATPKDIARSDRHLAKGRPALPPAID